MRALVAWRMVWASAAWMAVEMLATRVFFLAPPGVFELNWGGADTHVEGHI